jgi:hypothetical protein
MSDKELTESNKIKLSTLQSEMKLPDYKAKLFKVYNEEFEEKISTIMTQSESEFMKNYILRMNNILEDLYSNDAFEDDIFIKIMKETEKKVYDTLYKKSLTILLKAWNELQATIQQQLKQNQRKVQNPNSKNPLDGMTLPIIYLKNFNKHCIHTESPIHTCKGKFIPVFDENKNLTHVICVKCKSAYFSNCILMFCNNCNTEYYSSHTTFDKDYQPATWDRYHCGAIVNDYMRCLDCMSMLYIRVSTGWLKCLNKSCKFEADPTTIFWVCMLCKKDFATGAKIYNPMDYRIFKIAIKNIMLNKLPARPDSVPCCNIIPNQIKFFHKNECRGILYTGTLREKSIAVCSKCKVMSQRDKLLWTCPMCLNRFREKSEANQILPSATPKGDKENLTSDYDVSKDLGAGSNKVLNKNPTPFQKSISLIAGSDNSSNKDLEDNNNPDSKIKLIKSLKNEASRSSSLNNNLDKTNSNKFAIFNPIKKVEVNLDEDSNKKENFRGPHRLRTGSAVTQEDSNPQVKRSSSKQPIQNLKNTEKSGEKEKQVKNPTNPFISIQKEDIEQSKGEKIYGQSNKDIKKVAINLGPNFSSAKNLENLNSDLPSESTGSSRDIEREITKSSTNDINAINNILKTSEACDSSDQSKLKSFNLQDYTIITQIGEGTFGKIYLVEDKLKNYFSLKKIIANDEFELEGFEQEYQLINQVRHPNVLKILATAKQKLDKTTYGLYILMETGLSDWEKEIKSRLTLKKYYSEQELIDIFKQIIYALVFLQRNNISHRDIKPQNILIFKNNVYKLADFGEAKKLSMMDTNKQLNTLRGTELYMSPLLFNAMRTNQSDIKHNSYKSDVYSVAYCFIHAATLNIHSLYEFRRVYDMKTTRILLEKYLKAKYSQNLIDILYKMLEINEANRFDFIDLEVVLNKYF